MIVNVPGVLAVVSVPVKFHTTVEPEGIVIPYPALAHFPAMETLAIESVNEPFCVKVYPDEIDNVPAPETVGIENVTFAPIVSVYPELTDKVPAPDIADMENVAFTPIVSVYPELTDKVPEPETVPKLNVYDAPNVSVYPEFIVSVPVPDIPVIFHVSFPMIVMVFVPNAIVPAPEIVGIDSVVFTPIVSVYPEPTDKVPEPTQYVSLEDVVMEAPTVTVCPLGMKIFFAGSAVIVCVL